MKPLLALLGLLLLPFASALAQTVQAPQATAALVCAYNSSPPAITSGNFAYVQCDASGHVISSSSFATVPFTATGGTTSSTLVDRFGHLKNAVDDFGAVADGATNSTAAITAMGTAGAFLIPPTTSPLTNYIKTTTAQNAFPKMFALFGSGRVSDSASNLRGPIYSVMNSVPTKLGSYNANSVLTSFNADFSKNPLAIEFNLLGATTAGSPASGYAQDYTTSPFYLYEFNTAGHNESLTGNDGRTGIAPMTIRMAQSGQGDMSAFFFTGIATSVSQGGATTYQANAEIGGIGGSLTTSQDYQHMEGIGDINLIDGGKDVTGHGLVQNFNRSVSLGGLNTNWMGTRLQSIGTAPIDSFASYVGPAGMGIDMTDLTSPDQALKTISMVSGGTGFLVGDELCPGTGTFDQKTCIVVNTVNGGGTILTWGLSRRGLYSVLPTGAPGTVAFTGGAGTGATFSLAYYGGLPALVLPANSGVFFNASNDNNHVTTNYSNTTLVGNSYIDYKSGSTCIEIVVGNIQAGCWTSAGLTNATISSAANTLDVKQVAGTATNDTANAGNLGEYIESNVPVGSPVSLSTGTAANLTTTTLTAGDWDVWGNVITTAGGTTVMTNMTAEIQSGSNCTTPTLVGPPNHGSYVRWQGSVTAPAMGLGVPAYPLQLSASTTVCLITQVAFSTSTLSIYGALEARRRR